jgi:hypothetical protein
MKTMTFTKCPAFLAVQLLAGENFPPVGYARLVRISETMLAWVGRTDFRQYVIANTPTASEPINTIKAIA